MGKRFITHATSYTGFRFNQPEILKKLAQTAAL